MRNYLHWFLQLNFAYIMQLVSDTIIALSTPFGSSGIAVVRLSGHQSFSIVDKFFKLRHATTLVDIPAKFMNLGEIWIDNRLIDQGFVVRFISPQSYTGEDVVELHLHGNMLIVGQIIDYAVACGARLATSGEFTRRAFLNGKMDLTQVEALSDVIVTESARELEIAQRQLRGELRNKFEVFRKRLIELLALLELELDFAEEGYTFVSETDLQSFLESLLKYCQDLTRVVSNGTLRRKGPQILLLGSPNAGKSSLFNAFVGFSRSIVSPLPGTTRDYIEESLYYHSTLFRFVDCAGLRETSNVIEAAGVERTQELIEMSDLVLFLVDGSSPFLETEYKIFEDLSTSHSAVAFQLVHTKADLYCHRFQGYVYCSILDLSSISCLLDLIHSTADTQNSEAITLLSQRQYHILMDICGVVSGILTSLPTLTEILVAELRRILIPLSHLTGVITTDDVLNQIFASFCIGK